MLVMSGVWGVPLATRVEQVLTHEAAVKAASGSNAGVAFGPAASSTPYGGSGGGIFPPGSFLHDYWKLAAAAVLGVGGFLWWRSR